MTGPTMALAYEDHVQDAVFDHAGYVSSTPGLVTSLDKLQTLQLGDPMVLSGGLNDIKAIWAPLTEFAREVSVISLLDLRFVDFMDQLEVWYYNDALGEVFLGDFAGYDLVPSPDFIRNIHIFLDAPAQARGVRVRTYRDAEHSIGRLWAGPLWIPPAGIEYDFESSIEDPGEMQLSRGLQGYPRHQQRRRRLEMTLSALPYEQAYGNAANTVIDLQQLGYRVGTTSPVIAFPRTLDEAGDIDEHVIHRLGIYGHLTAPIAIRHIDGNFYRSGMSVAELL